jgi:hypothetical protein
MSHEARGKEVGNTKLCGKWQEEKWKLNDKKLSEIVFPLMAHGL